MKKSLIIIVLIVGLLFTYCWFENSYVNRLTSNVEKIVCDFEQTASKEKMSLYFFDLKTFFQKEWWLMRMMISQEKLDELFLSVAKTEDYLDVMRLEEAKQSAGEVLCRLKNIAGKTF